MEETGKKRKAELMPPLVLAFMGDAVYEVYVRDKLIGRHPNDNTHSLHTQSSSIVCAGAQAKTALSIFGELSEQERDVYRRGRNAKSNTVPKNADVGEYRMATGFEAVLGFLYLSGDETRLGEVLSLAARHWEENAHGADKP